MERAGSADTDPDAERKGLGTPATRAAVIEKLVKSGFVQRKRKQLIPTKNGNNLVCVLPDTLTSPQLTAEWENALTQMIVSRQDVKTASSRLGHAQASTTKRGMSAKNPPQQPNSTKWLFGAGFGFRRKRKKP